MSNAQSPRSGTSYGEPAVRLLELWRERAQKSAEAHYKIASNRLWWNNALSAAAVVASTALGSSAIANADDALDEGYTWVLAVTGVLVAILAAVHRTLAPGERGERHRAAGAAWDKIFNDLCVRLATAAAAPPDEEELTKIKEEMNDLVDSSPTIPQRWFEKVSLVETYSKLSEDPGMLRRMRWWRRKRLERGRSR